MKSYNPWHHKVYYQWSRLNFSQWFLERIFQISGDNSQDEYDRSPVDRWTNRSIELLLIDIFTMLHSDHPKQWSHFLLWAQLWYNIIFHSTTRITPYKVVFIHPPPSIPIYVLKSSFVGEVNHELKDRDEVAALFNAHLTDKPSLRRHVNIIRG